MRNGKLCFDISKVCKSNRCLGKFSIEKFNLYQGLTETGACFKKIGLRALNTKVLFYSIEQLYTSLSDLLNTK